MRQKFLVGLMILTVAFSNVFANNEESVNQRIVRAFNTEFSTAVDEKWEVKQDFARVTFKMNQQIMTAYYNERGERLALSRNILSSHLPMTLLTELKTGYADFWITDLFEMVFENDANYYVTLENGNQILTLKSEGAGWTVYKKDKKI